MPLDHTNMMILNFMKESYRKADERCTQWFIRNQRKLEKMAELPEKFKGRRIDECTKLPIEMSMNTLIAQLPSAAVHRRKKALFDGVIQGKAQIKGKWKDIKSEPIMLPVNSDIQNIIYKAIPEGGRRVYLEERNRMKPEEKYNFCVTSSAVCGWRMNDSQHARQPATYGRRFTFKRDLLSRTGPHPDPAYYQKPPEIPYSKCLH